MTKETLEWAGEEKKNPLKLIIALAVSALVITSVSAVLLIGQPPKVTKVEVWVSSKDGSYKLTKVRNETVEPLDNSPVNYTFNIDPTVTYQSILGFGSSFESSSCYNLSRLEDSVREEVIGNLVNPDVGIGMNLMRICIGTSDFTGEGWYTYDDMPEGQTDPNLEYFTIEKDKEYIIPAIKIALKKNPNLKIFASPWSPPAWMKTAPTGNGGTVRIFAASPSGHFDMTDATNFSVWVYTDAVCSVQLRLKDSDGDGGSGADGYFLWSSMSSMQNQWTLITWNLNQYPSVPNLDRDRIAAIELYVGSNGTHYFDSAGFKNGSGYCVFQNFEPNNGTPRIYFLEIWHVPSWFENSTVYEGTRSLKTVPGSPTLCGGNMKSEWFNTYAEYFVKFIKSYEAEHIPIYAITVQNEPSYVTGRYPTCGWTWEQERDFVKNYLGPKFENEGISTKIWIYDWNFDLWNWPDSVLNDPSAASYIDGTAFHHYAGNPTAMTYLHESHPDKHIYFTEGSTYDALKIIGYLRNWAESYNAWVTLIDENGNPNNGPHIVSTTCIVLKNDMSLDYTYEYYMYGQFMKFIPRGAVRIFSDAGDSVVSNVAFKNPNSGEVVFVIANASNYSKSFKIVYGGSMIKSTIGPESTATFKWVP